MRQVELVLALPASRAGPTSTSHRHFCLLRLHTVHCKAARRHEEAKKRKAAAAEEKKNEVAAKRRKKKRAANSTGQGALAQLEAAGPVGWKDALGQMKVAELDGLAVILALECKFEGTKSQKRALLEPEIGRAARDAWLWR